MRKRFLIAVLSVMILGTAAVMIPRAGATIKMHVKDLPEHGLRLISPSDSTFDQKLRTKLKGEPDAVINNMKPYSIFLENNGAKSIVAYVIRWCFTRPDGRNEYYREAVLDPRALMDGPTLGEEYKRQSGRIEPDSSSFHSLLSLDGSSPIKIELTSDEVEQVKQGKKFDRESFLRRYQAKMEKYTDITVSIDGAFFEDGTFVGPDATGFFDRTKAAIDAKRDLLTEVAIGLFKVNKSKEEVYRHIEAIASQTDETLDSQSTPAQYYNYFKMLYANEILQTRRIYGEDKGLAEALSPSKKPWPKLQKK